VTATKKKAKAAPAKKTAPAKEPKLVKVPTPVGVEEFANAPATTPAPAPEKKPAKKASALSFGFGSCGLPSSFLLVLQASRFVVMNSYSRFRERESEHRLESGRFFRGPEHADDANPTPAPGGLNPNALTVANSARLLSKVSGERATEEMLITPRGS